MQATLGMMLLRFLSRRPASPCWKEARMPRGCGAALFGVLAAVSSCTGSAGGESATRAKTPQLSIELQVSRSSIGISEVLKCSAYLVNNGAEAAVVVLPGDGSDCGWRTPVVRWTPAASSGRDCGNINSLRANEV